MEIIHSLESSREPTTDSADFPLLLSQLLMQWLLQVFLLNSLEADKHHLTLLLCTALMEIQKVTGTSSLKIYLTIFQLQLQLE